MRPTRVYIAGPITHGSQFDHVRVAIQTADLLWKEGFSPLVPHLTCFFHMLCPHPAQDWYEYDNQWLDLCDCLLRLPGLSTGSDAEVARMLKQGKPVFYSLEEICSKMPKVIE